MTTTNSAPTLGWRSNSPTLATPATVAVRKRSPTARAVLRLCMNAPCVTCPMCHHDRARCATSGEPVCGRSEVQIRLFGGVSAVTDRGDPVDVGASRTQAVLAVLALSPRTAVPVPRLIDLVWADTPPQTADKAL